MNRMGVVVLVLLLTAASCGSDAKGDLEAFCELIRRPAGTVTDPAVDDVDFDQLLDVAPREVKPAVEQLVNTAGDINDIKELDQLFAAAFDPEAQAAREVFDMFATENCGVSSGGVTGAGGPTQSDYAQAIAEFAESNFRGESWITKVRYDVGLAEGVLEDVEVNFVIGARDDEALRACQSLGVWLYDIQGGTGKVNVIDDELIVAQRAGPDASCVET